MTSEKEEACNLGSVNINQAAPQLAQVTATYRGHLCSPIQ